MPGGRSAKQQKHLKTKSQEKTGVQRLREGERCLCALLGRKSKAGRQSARWGGKRGRRRWERRNSFKSSAFWESGRRTRTDSGVAR